MRQLDMLARFESLRLHVALLNHDWNEFKVLFVNKDPQTVAALNLEPYFFFDHQRLAYYQIVQTIANLIDTDPAVLSEEINDLLLECTLTIRENINSILDAEQDMEIENPLNLNQLGAMAGYGSSVVYQALRSEPPRNMIGIQTLARFSLALGMSPHTLLMPNDRFKKEIIPAYKNERAPRTAKK